MLQGVGAERREIWLMFVMRNVGTVRPWEVSPACPFGDAVESAGEKTCPFGDAVESARGGERKQKHFFFLNFAHGSFVHF